MGISKDLSIILAASGAMALGLAANVVRIRLGTKQTMGEGAKDSSLQLAVRTHANFVEFAPLFLLMLFGLDQQGDRDTAKIGWAFLLARIAHAAGLLTNPESILRKVGFLGTVAAFGAASAKLYLNAM